MGTTPAPLIDVRRSDGRSETSLTWLRGRHSFWVGGQPYDPGNTHHGLLVVHNEDTIRPGSGFDTHPHRDMEIVTWVLEGALVHQDSAGNSGVIYPGLAQRMSAGTGILHSERNDSRRLGRERHTNPVHLIQMWVVPDETGVTPGYEQLEVDNDLLSGGLVTVASGMARHHGDAAIRIRNRHAALQVDGMPGPPSTFCGPRSGRRRAAGRDDLRRRMDTEGRAQWTWRGHLDMAGSPRPRLSRSPQARCGSPDLFRNSTFTCGSIEIAPFTSPCGDRNGRGETLFCDSLL